MEPMTRMIAGFFYLGLPHQSRAGGGCSQAADESRTRRSPPPPGESAVEVPRDLRVGMPGRPVATGRIREPRRVAAAPRMLGARRGHAVGAPAVGAVIRGLVGSRARRQSWPTGATVPRSSWPAPIAPAGPRVRTRGASALPGSTRRAPHRPMAAENVREVTAGRWADLVESPRPPPPGFCPRGVVLSDPDPGERAPETGRRVLVRQAVAPGQLAAQGAAGIAHHGTLVPGRRTRLRR